MACPIPSQSYVDVTFEIGTDSLVIAPLSFDVGPGRRKELRDDGVIYCEFKFEAMGTKGSIYDVLLPEDFQRLAQVLTALRSSKAEEAQITGLDGWITIKLGWNSERQVAVFHVASPASFGSDHWTSRIDVQYDDPHFIRRHVELEFTLVPTELDEPLIELESLLQHLRELQREGPEY